MRSMLKYVVAALLASNVGCGSHAPEEDYCVPGQQRSCTLAGCGAASQTCEDWAYGACTCVLLPQDDAGVADDSGAAEDSGPPTDTNPPPADTLPQQDATPPQQDTQPACPEGTACNYDNGICRNGSCCEGCWDGSSCRTGVEVGACGGHGAACVDCGDSGTSCAVNVCSSYSHTCVTQPQNEGQTCTECGASTSATCQTGRCRPTDVNVCMMPMVKCLGQGTCDPTTSPHICRGGCCDGMICGFN